MWRWVVLIALIIVGCPESTSKAANKRPSPLFAPYIRDVSFCYAKCAQKECGEAAYQFRVSGIVSTYGHGGPYRSWITVKFENTMSSAVLDESVLVPKSSNRIHGVFMGAAIPDEIKISVAVVHNIILETERGLVEAPLYIVSDKIELAAIGACGEPI